MKIILFLVIVLAQVALFYWLLNSQGPRVAFAELGAFVLLGAVIGILRRRRLG